MVQKCNANSFSATFMALAPCCHSPTYSHLDNHVIGFLCTLLELLYADTSKYKYIFLSLSYHYFTLCSFYLLYLVDFAILVHREPVYVLNPITLRNSLTFLSSSSFYCFWCSQDKMTSSANTDSLQIFYL